MTTFTEKVEELLNDYNGYDFCGSDYCAAQGKATELIQLLNEAHQAEISRVLERVKDQKKTFGHSEACPHCNGDLTFEAVPLEAFNKIKGELQ